MSKCHHRNREKLRCQRESGHGGRHRRDVPHEGYFTISEWNNNGEEEIPEIFFEIKCDYDDTDRCRRIKEQLIRGAKAELAVGMVFEIRAKLYPKDHTTDYGRKKITRDEAAKDWGMCWYVVPKQPEGFEHLETATEPLVDYDYDGGKYIAIGGYILIARVKVVE